MGWVPWLEQRANYQYVVWQRGEGDEPWKKHQRPWRTEAYTRIPVDEITPNKHIVTLVGDRFRPSQDLASKGQVLQRMRELDWDVRVQSRTGGWVVDFRHPQGYFGTIVEAELPLAVALAALAAVRHTPVDPPASDA